MVNVLQAMVLTDGAKMVKTPTYHVFMMYKPYMDATVLPIELKSPWYNKDKWAMPAVSASAVRDKAGKIHVGLANLDPNRPMTVSVQIDGIAGSAVSGQLLTAPAMNTLNSFEVPDGVVPVAFDGARIVGKTLSLTLPAKSVVMLDLQ
jgi:alpha-N-arabinofuranosidase